MKVAGPSSIRPAPNADGSNRLCRYAPNRRIFAYARLFRSDLARLVMTATAYLAGPDVFLPDAPAHAARKVEICRRFGLRGLPPLNEDAATIAGEGEAWQTIYQKD